MKLFILAAVLLATLAQAETEKKKKIIDVGDIEVKGEVRKPFLQLLDSDQNVKEMLPKLTTQELKNFEEILLKTQKAEAKNERR